MVSQSNRILDPIEEDLGDDTIIFRDETGDEQPQKRNHHGQLNENSYFIMVGVIVEADPIPRLENEREPATVGRT